MKLDLHIHSEKSPDGSMSLETIVEAARKKGLHGIAISDHDRAPSDWPVYDDFVIIPAAEISSPYGHLLGYFIKELPPTRDFSETIDDIHRQGGLTVIAHPFEHFQDEDHFTPYLDRIDGLEYFNSRAERKHDGANDRARAYGIKHGLRPFAGSDAHRPPEIGNGWLELPIEPTTDLDKIRSALLEGKGEAHGQLSKAIYCAQSQFYFRRFLGFPKNFPVWVAFACKCVWRDLTRKKKEPV